MDIRIKFLIAGVCLVLGARCFAAETNSISLTPSEVAAQNAVNGYLQIQAQLHDTQIALENDRREARQNAEDMAARIQALQQAIAAQRTDDIQTAQKNQQFTLMMAGAFGLIVIAAVLFMAYLQWRAVTRLVEFSALRSPEFSYRNGRDAPSLVTGAAVEQSNARLFGAVDHLQKRILELEQASRPPLAEKRPPGATVAAGSKNGASASNDREECIANLLAEGQSLFDADKPEKALECFETALGIDPKHTDALVKKGGALEKLGRTDEAIACYDRAIEANRSSTIAHLQKGALFNRLARYDEALQCYERALQTQEKKTA